MTTPATYIYMLSVAATALAIWIFLRLALTRAELKKQRRLGRLKSIDAVPTESPDTDSDASFRKRGRERIKARFSVTRKFVYAVFCVAALVLLALPFMGAIPATAVSLAIAVVTVLTGIAARPFLEDFVAGITISFSNLVRIGDVVDIDEHYGIVEDITITHTIVRRWDWIRYTVPNTVMLQKPFMNYTVRDMHRWVHVEFYVDWQSDMQLVQHLAEQAPSNSRFFDDVEPPQFWVLELEKESIKCMVVAWATSPADGWMLSVDIRKALLKGFQEQGIATHTNFYSPRSHHEQRQPRKDMESTRT